MNASHCRALRSSVDRSQTQHGLPAVANETCCKHTTSTLRKNHGVAHYVTRWIVLIVRSCTGQPYVLGKLFDTAIA